MNIALIGYGKMGKVIEQVALGRGHTINLTIDLNNADDLTPENLSGSDVAIEFTGPHSAFSNVMRCLEAGIPVVCGSTGWLAQYPQAAEYCGKQNGALLYASNFSIGVNIFFELNRHLARIMNRQEAYDVRITEVHHTEKKDAPSGTAITLAEQILENVRRKSSWVNHAAARPGELSISSVREDPAPGTHRILYTSEVDYIEIIHTAHNRNGFALGSVLAAEFLRSRTGIYSMQDVLSIG
jgi:4-hydroxy-tetrahydrodipicolinate reductase